MRVTLAAIAVLFLPAAASAAGDVPENIVLTGVVRDVEGGAVAGASVVLEVSLYRREGPQPVETYRATSNAEGRFEMTLPRLFYIRRLEVEAPGDEPRALWRVDPPGILEDVGRGRAKAEVTLTVHPATSSIAGRVSVNDAPVAGAVVRFSRLRRFPGLRDEGRLEALTDADGNYRIDRLVPGYYESQTVTAPPEANAVAFYRPSSDSGVHRPAAGATVRKDFRLSPGKHVAGRVLDENGKPVSDVDVSVPGRYPQVRTVTGADGRFVLAGIPDRMQSVHVQAPEASGLAPVTLTVREDAGDVVLERGGSLEGTVKGPDGTPIAGAELHLNSLTDTRRVTDAWGRYHYDGLLTGRYCVQVAPPEGSKWAPTEVDAVALLKVRRRFDVVAPVGCRVEGVITDEAGKPVAGARVFLPNQSETRTDADGRYVLQGITDQSREHRNRPRMNALLKVEPPDGSDCMEKRIEIFFGLESTLRRDVTLKTGGTLAGRVLGPEGNPVVGARILVETETYVSPYSLPKGVDYYRGIDRYAMPRPFTDADGRFTLRGVGEKPITVRAIPPPGLNALTASQSNVRVKPGSEQALEMHLSAGAVVTGVLRDTEGKPVRDVRVELGINRESWQAAETVTSTDASGRFRFSRLHPGKCSIDVPRVTSSQESHLRLLPSSSVRLELKPGETVERDVILNWDR